MNKIIPVLLIIFLANSCTEEVKIDLDSTYTRLVVFGEVSTDTMAHRVELKRSADYFYNQPADMVTGARVEIAYGDTVIDLTERPDQPGIYETSPDFFGIPGTDYILNIANVDIDENGESENYSATSYLHPVNPIDSITLNYVSNSFFSGWEINVWAYDPGDVQNFYVFKALVNNKLVSDTLTELVIQNDDLFNGNYTNGITSQFLVNSKPDEKLEAGDTVTFEIDGITEEYFNFLLEAQSESFGQNPLFSGPPANVTSNISNNALGFFTAYSIARSSRIVTEIPDPENRK